MAEEGGDLASGQQQHPVEGALQRAQGGEMRGAVVIGQRDEVEPARRCRLHRAIDRAGGFRARLRTARAIAVAAVHMEVAAIPARRGMDRRVFQRGDGGAAFDVDLGLEGRGHAFADVGHAEDQRQRPAGSGPGR
jgi:hypothetical protein